MSEVSAEKPTELSIDYPDRKLNRAKTFLRPILAIPILIILGGLFGAPFFWEQGMWHWKIPALPAFVIGPTALMILFKQKYPSWWFDWNLNMTRFSTRVFSYMALLTDVYPSTDDPQGVDLKLYRPNPEEDLVRWMPYLKWFLAIPHYVVLFFLNTAGTMAIVLAWFSILFTGRYPKKLFNFVVEIYHWNLRVVSYAFLFITDKYPPFSFGGWQE
ncbi:MAG: DUF4389 domain-containing protein [Candidatus Bipolaricaulota bacterium]